MIIATLYIVLTYCKSPLNLKVYKSYIFPAPITSVTRFIYLYELQIMFLQQKWLFNTFLSSNCRGHKDTGCPDANVYVLNSSCHLDFEFWLNSLSAVLSSEKFMPDQQFHTFLTSRSLNSLR